MECSESESQSCVIQEKLRYVIRRRRRFAMGCRPPPAGLRKGVGIANILEESARNRIAYTDNAMLALSQGRGFGSASLRINVMNKQQQQTVRMDRRDGIGGSTKKLKDMVTQAKENGGGGMGGILLWTQQRSNNSNNADMKQLEQKRQKAEIKRTQQEEDLRENHPFFDTPLFIVGRDSKFRRLCQKIVNTRYENPYQTPQLAQAQTKSNLTKEVHKLLALVPYLDWIMILVTTCSSISMLCETPRDRVVENPLLQITEYIFVLCMTAEMFFKLCSNGLFFTPQAMVRDFGGVLELFIYMVGLVFIIWRPTKVPPGSGAQILMLLRCLRPLRIFVLVPHMRKVMYELCRGFKEILMVSALILFFAFMFASYGVQRFGGKLRSCNDRTIKHRSQCHGAFLHQVRVTEVTLPGEGTNLPISILVPRVWTNPRNFNFDNIGYAMLALFQVLSLEGWLEIREVLIDRVGSEHALYVVIFVFIGCMIGLTLFVGVVFANYSENKGTALLTVDQRRWLDLKSRIKIVQPLRVPPRPEKNRLRGVVYDLTISIWFNHVIVFLIIANSSLLCVKWDHQGESYRTYLLALISAAFTLLFMIEVILKIIAMGIEGYLQSGRNSMPFDQRRRAHSKRPTR